MDILEAYRHGILDGVELALEILAGPGGVGGVEAAACSLRSGKARRLLARYGLEIDGSPIVPRLVVERDEADLGEDEPDPAWSRT